MFNLKCLYNYRNKKMLKKGDKINYFGLNVEIIDFNETHVLIMLEDGTKICTNINAVKK